MQEEDTQDDDVTMEEHLDERDSENMTDSTWNKLRDILCRKTKEKNENLLIRLKQKRRFSEIAFASRESWTLNRKENFTW